MYCTYGSILTLYETDQILQHLRKWKSMNISVQCIHGRDDQKVANFQWPNHNYKIDELSYFLLEFPQTFTDLILLCPCFHLCSQTYLLSE